MARKPANPTRRVNRGRGHSYYIDGEKTKGVTTLLGLGIPKPALVNWAATTVSDYVINRLDRRKLDDGETVFVADELVEDLRDLNARKQRPEKMGAQFPRTALAKVLATVRYEEVDKASKKGTQVHRLAEQLSLGEEVEVPDELEGHVDAYLAFLEDWQPRDAQVEVIVINRTYRYMGTVDMICRLPPPWGITLLDIKTARSGVFGDTALQLVGYGRAETILDPVTGDETPMPKIESYGAVWVRADGYDMIPMDITDEEWRCFLYASEVGRWLDYLGGGRTKFVKGDAADPPAWPAEKGDS